MTAAAPASKHGGRKPRGPAGAITRTQACRRARGGVGRATGATHRSSAERQALRIGGGDGPERRARVCAALGSVVSGPAQRARARRELAPSPALLRLRGPSVARHGGGRPTTRHDARSRPGPNGPRRSRRPLAERRARAYNMPAAGRLAGSGQGGPGSGPPGCAALRLSGPGCGAAGCRGARADRG